MTTTNEAINTAFASDSKLRKRIFDAIDEIPQHASLFEDIAQYYLSNQRFSVVNGKDETEVGQPTKKRKLEDGTAAGSETQADQPRTVILEARDISFSIPQRKKLHLSIVQYGNGFNAPSTTFALCARNPATNQAEFEYPIAAFAHALRVSVPEKTQKQYNFCLLPPQAPTASGSTGAQESMIWTVNHGPLKSCQIHSEELKALVGTENILEDALDVVLQHKGSKLVYPTEAEFVSALVESHRKNDKAYHVKAFRGSKDGYLFFLETGIFFGFKKPLAFFPFDHVESLSYTAVLQRTFNLVIVVRAPDDTEEQEIEFSMIDQADFAGIDAYIRRHQLQDASMAEARRAKQFKVNGSKGNVTAVDGQDEQSELQKAEQELEDEEDEMEEDYDPENEEGSDYSGSSDDEDYEYEKPGKGKDLVKDELGSEAEDVEITDEEDEVAEEEEDAEDDEDDGGNDQVVDVQPPSTRKSVVSQPATFVPISHHNGPDLDDEDQL